MVTVEWWGLWGVEGVEGALDFLAVFPTQCSGNCRSKSGSSPWNSGISDACRRTGKCGMGVQLCQLDVSKHEWQRGHPSAKGWHKLLWWLDVEHDVCFLKLLLLSQWEQWQDCDLLKSLLCLGHNRWSVVCPFGSGCVDALNKICLSGVVFLREESCWDSPVQSGQNHHSCNTVHWGSGSQMTHSSTNKTYIIIGHHTDCVRVSVWLLVTVLH